jgi:hypothetical protein
LDAFIQKHFAIGFPIFFVTLWLGVTTFLGLLSGWFDLASCYPDRTEEPLLRLRGQSGSMGPLAVGMNGILTLDACPSGLRVGIFRLFGPFQRDFFVPWSDIEVVRKDRFFWRVAELRFAQSSFGRLGIRDHVADRLARAAPGRWPERSPIAPQSPRQVLAGVVKEWVLVTVAASAFFILAPRIMAAQIGAPRADFPPLAVAILFPAVVFGVAAVFRYIARVRP